ncbi:MAG: sodium:proton antiporter [Spirochaetia bacterium]|nr:sodium:proton antiporter [Spirochaetia bacterium]
MTTLIFMGAQGISIIWVLPFAIFLLCIAIAPLINAHFWEKNLWWIALGVFCAPMLLALLFFLGEALLEKTLEKVLEYISFITLLASLYVISGGIFIHGHFRGKPLVNAGFLIFGGLIASFIGTTGASMLLIRPILRANAGRKRNAHVVVFFIFIVSNIGGLLTPLGDPPLFLGYLQGVPFLWTAQNLWREWLFVCSLTILIFYFWDSYIYRNDGPGILHKHDEVEPFQVSGKFNILLLLGIVLAIYFQGYFLTSVRGWPHFGPQELAMLLLTAVSLFLMPVKHPVRLHNGFSWKPILEVVYLFAAIFVTMIPALYILETRGAEIGIQKAWQFFLATGILSSFLDNAPTYLTFLSLGKALNTVNDLGFIFHDGKHVSSALLAAISCGAVFMGANSYIGNGPNFMVRAIAEERGVKMPGFFTYMLYAAVVLGPLFALVTFIFF